MSISFTKHTNASSETSRIAEFIGEHIERGTVLCLIGDLGAGKTLFTQGLARGLGVTDDVTSPTFNLMNIYHGRLDVYHFDLYRLEHESELDEIGFYEYTDEPRGIAVIEWADKFVDCLPDDYLKIEIARASENDAHENEREISFMAIGQSKAIEKLLKEIEENC